jgi:hypothetical protein
MKRLRNLLSNFNLRHYTTGFEPLLDSYLQSMPAIMAPHLAQFRAIFMQARPSPRPPLLT